jgi:hypothetical protein
LFLEFGASGFREGLRPVCGILSEEPFDQHRVAVVGWMVMGMGSAGTRGRVVGMRVPVKMAELVRNMAGCGADELFCAVPEAVPQPCRLGLHQGAEVEEDDGIDGSAAHGE